MTKREKAVRHKVQVVSRVVMLCSFGLLVLFAITQTARMLAMVELEHEKGVPKAWSALLSSSNPEKITVPITYFDQKFDSCDKATAERQFEYIGCGFEASGLTQGLVAATLGADGKPVAAMTTATAANRAALSNRGVWGNNFTRWFNEVEGKSQQVNGSLEFVRQGEDNIYVFGGSDFFPLDGNEFSAGDLSVDGHNFHFTAMTSFPFEVQADGTERWEFRGDDDVWVFINGSLVLDIGGLHEAVDGYFVINANGTVAATVDGKTKTLDLGLKNGEVAQLSFFYAERSTTEANCKITIKNMVWPIRAEAEIVAETVENKLIRYTSSIANRDPANALEVTHMAAFLNEGEAFNEDGFGFLPLNDGSLFYTLTPDDEESWRAVEIGAPHASDEGGKLAESIWLTPSGIAGDTVYFAFYVAPEKTEGIYYNTITYKTRLGGAESLARAADAAGFANIEVVEPSEPKEEPKEEPSEPIVEPSEPTVEPETPAEPAVEPETPGMPITPEAPAEPEPEPEPSQPSVPAPAPTPESEPAPAPEPEVSEPVDENYGNLAEADDGYLDPLGESAEIFPSEGMTDHDGALFAPDTGVADFATIILSQWFLLGTLLTFGVSFAVYYPNRSY
jgi:fibro-slime domain-containing protein